MGVRETIAGHDRRMSNANVEKDRSLELIKNVTRSAAAKI
jgi:hypothetical protein